MKDGLVEIKSENDNMKKIMKGYENGKLLRMFQQLMASNKVFGVDS
jgi:hypothetical protein